ncbi:MAG: VWA domain-containing protein [Chitinophagaceae bacterium]
MILRQTSLSANIVQFCRFLRLKNFTIGIEGEALTLQSLQFIDYTDPSVFRLALRTMLCRSKAQSEEFDTLFNDYWKQVEKAVDSKTKEGSAEKKPTISQPIQFKSLKAWLHGNRNDETEETATYSIRENLSQKDFSAIPGEEVDELMQTIKSLSKRLAAKSNRRHKFSRQINLPDLRQTLRKNLRRGGELVELAYRKPKRNRVKLVLLCDVSKSMELYTAFFIQFMYAFQQVYGRMETFTFGTSLKRVTPFLREKNFREALQLLGAENNNWEGGTRIGESLDSFVKLYSKKILDSKTVVIILSDGWDRGDMAVLKESMGLIRARAKKIIWLNPLAGFASYRPDVIGMQTAMPFIDVFAPAHNAESLRRLGKWL